MTDGREILGPAIVAERPVSTARLVAWEETIASLDSNRKMSLSRVLRENSLPHFDDPGRARWLDPLGALASASPLGPLLFLAAFSRESSPPDSRPRLLPSAPAVFESLLGGDLIILCGTVDVGDFPGLGDAAYRLLLGLAEDGDPLLDPRFLPDCRLARRRYAGKTAEIENLLRACHAACLGPVSLRTVLAVEHALVRLLGRRTV